MFSNIHYPCCNIKKHKHFNECTVMHFVTWVTQGVYHEYLMSDFTSTFPLCSVHPSTKHTEIIFSVN